MGTSAKTVHAKCAKVGQINSTGAAKIVTVVTFPLHFSAAAGLKP